MRRLVLGGLLAVAVFAGAGCGGDYSDLIGVRRSGSLPDARVDLVVNDGGTARCDGGRARELRPRLLLDARDIVRELRTELEDSRVYPSRANSLLRYQVEAADGELTFSDTDGTRDPDLGRLAQFVRAVAREVCGLER